MAKTKPSNKKIKKRDKSALNRVAASPSKMSSLPTSPSILLSQATSALQQGDIAGAVTPAKRALGLLDIDSEEALPALNLLGEIHVELGDIESARQYFLQAAAIDEDGALGEDVGGGAEKFLWLAQLSEEGGQDSVDWFEKGALSLRIYIQALLERKKLDAVAEAMLEEKRRKLSVALCGVVEVYMTDLSWEEDAEQKCEALVTEATMVAPGFAEPWQTLANVRISQSRIEDARAALKRSLDLWKDLPPENTVVPDFPTRVSLARLLMEADMDVEAIEVLERLVGEDDSSVEVWYLGGWGLYIMGEKQKNGEAKVENGDGDGENWKVSWISSRQWLTHSLRLFDQQDYEDERLGEHAKELLASLNAELGGETVNEEEEEWEDEDEGDASDEEMAEV
ncbi:putative assembly chaperone of rpl4 [Lachnellula hyalina]|uniref:Putative assembly chaperone of rpl4 n=1 Tax=Lachnellula hyalina TaxID=1316788 RepID=A0A8H8TZ56_9HELO|nr:putative assembly chaperone of rpl4 [Lachnellula hyalina]TVY27387.1 putative assembly chaperone of rpl4 [Lachnellula hyalina]